MLGNVSDAPVGISCSTTARMGHRSTFFSLFISYCHDENRHVFQQLQCHSSCLSEGYSPNFSLLLSFPNNQDTLLFHNTTSSTKYSNPPNAKLGNHNSIIPSHANGMQYQTWQDCRGSTNNSGTAGTVPLFDARALIWVLPVTCAFLPAKAKIKLRVIG